MKWWSALAVLSTVAAPCSAAEAPSADAIVRSLEKVKPIIVADPRKGVLAIDALKAAASTIPDQRRRRLTIAKADRLKAEALMRLNQTNRARKLIDSALSMTRSLAPKSRLMAEVLLSSGGLHAVKGEVSAALHAYQSAYRLFRILNDQRNQVLALVYIATLYNDARDNVSAMRYYDRAIEIPIQDTVLLIAIQNNRGSVLQDMGLFQQAEVEFLKAKSLISKEGGGLVLARIWENIARNRLKAGQVIAADRAIAAGLQVANRDAIGERPELLAIAAESALQRRDVVAAESLIAESFAGVDVATTTLPFREAHNTAYRVYAAAGNSGKALAHLTALKRLDDEATKLAISTSTALMGARFDFANQELRIATLKSERLRRTVAFEQARAHAERLLFFGAAGATALIIGLLAFGLFTIRRSRDRERAANAGLEKTNAELAKALAAKTEFLATTSHEIRTPLNGILGMTQVMLADQGLPHAQRDRLSVVHGAGLTMRALVDDILDVAKMETGNLTIEETAFDLAATIRDATQLWQEQARAKGLAFTVDLADCPEMAMGDPARLRQIVFNLLGNALKFTANGAVSLSAQAEADGRKLTIAVADTGIGIAADKLTDIFESFRQADAGTTRRYGGTGLGLAICRNLARAMGGDVTVTSQLGQGTTFTVTLPLREAPPIEAAQPVNATSGATMLVVERNPIARGMWRGLLERHFDTVAFAGSADEAVRLIDGSVVSVLIDDATIGGEPVPALVVARIAAAAAAVGAPVALLWQGQDAAAHAALLAAGATKVIAKPITGAALIAALPTIYDNTVLVSRAA